MANYKSSFSSGAEVDALLNKIPGLESGLEEVNKKVDSIDLENKVPDPTEENNGQVLAVLGGAFAFANAPDISVVPTTKGYKVTVTTIKETGTVTQSFEVNNSELPTPTQEDEGKAVVVENGRYVLKEQAENLETVFAEHEVTGFTVNDAGIYSAGIESEFELVAGESYIVDFDGERFKYTAELQGTAVITVGETGGDPFLIIYITEELSVTGYRRAVSTVREGESHTIGIYKKASYATEEFVKNYVAENGGSDLPEVTESDNGKVLGVVGGAWEAMETPAGGENAVAASVDLSAYESGTITETYPDGSVITYSFEFDSEGNPTKMTDSNGNKTTFIW